MCCIRKPSFTSKILFSGAGKLHWKNIWNFRHILQIRAYKSWFDHWLQKLCKYMVKFKKYWRFKRNKYSIFYLKNGGNLNAWFKTKVSVSPAYAQNVYDIYYLQDVTSVPTTYWKPKMEAACNSKTAVSTYKNTLIGLQSEIPNMKVNIISNVNMAAQI